MDHTQLYPSIDFPHDMSSLKLEQRSGHSFSMPALKQQTRYMDFTDASGWMESPQTKSYNTGMEFPGSTLPSKYTVPFVKMSQQGSQGLPDMVPPELLRSNGTMADTRSANLSFASHGQAGAGSAMGDLAYKHPQAGLKQAPMPSATPLSAQDLPDDVMNLISYINAANAKNGAPINDGSSSFTSSPEHDGFNSCGFDSVACGDNRTFLPSYDGCTFTPSTELSRFASLMGPQQVQMQASNSAGMGTSTAMASALSGLAAQNDSFVPYVKTQGLTTSAADLAQALSLAVDAQGSQELWHLVPTQPSHTAHTAHSNVLSGAWASANETWPTTTSGSLLNSTQDNSSACWAPATCNNAPDIWTDPSASLTDAEWNLAMEALAIKHRLLSAQQAQQLPLPDNMIALGATLSAYSTYDLLAQLPDVSAMPHGMHSHLAARQQAAARNAAKAMAAAARPKAKKPTKPAATALAAAAKARRASSAAGTSSAGSGELGEECEEGMDPRHAPGPPSNKLFVGNINSKVTEVELRQLIQGCGTITSVKVMYNSRKMNRAKDQWRSREYGFVDYATQEEADEAIARFNGARVAHFSKEGANMIVQYAKSSPTS